MDATDLKIINSMLENPGATYKDISKELRLTVGTVHNRIKSLENEKIITKSVPIVNSAKIGYDLVALINVAIKGGHLEMLEQKFSKHKNVCSVYDVTGNFDCLLIAKFKNTGELNSFVKKLMAEDFVERTNTSIVLNVIKEASSPFPLE